MQDIREIFLAIAIAVLVAVMLVFYAKCKRKFAKIIFGVVSGVALLYPAQFLVTTLGGVLSLNLFTATVSAVLGIPGVILLAVSAFL